MKTVEDFKALTRKEGQLILRDFSELDAQALPIEVEAGCYDVAGVVAAQLYEDFDLSKLSKKDLHLFLTAFAGGGTAHQIEPDLARIQRYVKFFAKNMQSQNAPATLKY